MYNRQLDTFIQVADHGSFSKAAEVLFISPTAVLKQVNLLENELGFPLFVRTNRGISLTEAGKSLYKDAKYIIRYSRDSDQSREKRYEKERTRDQDRNVAYDAEQVYYRSVAGRYPTCVRI